MSKRNPPGRFTGTTYREIGEEYSGKRMFDIIREHEHELWRLRAIVDANGLTASGGSGGGSGGSGENVDFYSWAANGPYIVDTEVDGRQPVMRTGTIAAVWMTRQTPGTGGSTILDLNRAPLGTPTGSSLYTTQANRPTIAYNDADYRVVATLPDVTSVVIGDELWPDTDQIEDGTPEGWRLHIMVILA